MDEILNRDLECVSLTFYAWFGMLTASIEFLIKVVAYFIHN